MAHFDAYANEYDAWYTTPLGQYADDVEKVLIKDLADPKEDERALDIGSGTGNYSIWLAERGLDVTALDQSDEMTKIAKKKAFARGLSIDFRLGHAETLPFEDESFDLVTSVTAVEFMDNPSTVLKEAMRVLKPGGRLVIGLLTLDSPWGEMYRQSVAANPDSLFAKAHLYKEEEVKDLLPQEYTLKKGLYYPPHQEFDAEEAAETEYKNQKMQTDRAGFFAVRWVKEEQR
ncbi:class I SAM-dependent methyltransferase [Bacillus marinisedimentorum]|uniref:class I SAM-dependent methyltransferase n=1 Tax=Bacillus marinisedimentorum TaxID=1821260 RepID=UPI0008724381|nr:class I SAM-dependent methyltransferase [Bacillus marinisedimentorum]